MTFSRTFLVFCYAFLFVPPIFKAPDFIQNNGPVSKFMMLYMSGSYTNTKYKYIIRVKASQS